MIRGRKTYTCSRSRSMLWFGFFLVASSNYVSNVSASTAEKSYDQICSIDPLLPHKMLFENDSNNNFVSGTTNDNTSSTTTTTTTTTNFNEGETFFRCICPNQDFHDVRTTRSFCPLNMKCAIPVGNGPVECIEGRMINNIAQMAWPVFLTSSGCLILIVVGTLYGISLSKFLQKAWSRRCCCRRKQSAAIVDEWESIEVDELLYFAHREDDEEAQRRREQQQEEGEDGPNDHNNHDGPLIPSRWHIRKFSNYLYQKKIVDAARIGWRREWKEYQKTLEPPNLLLPVCIYEHNHKNDLDGDNVLVADSSITATDTTTSASADTYGSVQSSSSSSNGQEKEEEDSSKQVARCKGRKKLDARCSILKKKNSSGMMNDNEEEPSCSICFAELTKGERVGDLQCGHLFHSECLKSWLQTGRRNTCPLCQAPNIATISFQQ